MRFSSSSTSNSVAVAVLLAALLTSPAGPLAQEQEGGRSAEAGSTRPLPDRPFVERSEVELALVEAVVLDRRGRHVRGVTKESLALFVNGVEVPIVSLDEIDIARPPRAAQPTPPVETVQTTEPEETRPAATPPLAAPPSPAEADAGAAERRKEVESRLDGPRWFIMAFDGYNNISPLRMSQVRRAAKKWVDSNMRERDLVAVYEFNPYLMSVGGFTNDAYLIKDAIDRIRMFPGDSMGLELVEQKLEQGDAIPRSFLENQLRNAGQFGGDLLRAERDQFYMNMTSIAEVMGDLPGTKAVLLFSGGFPVTRTRDTAARGGFTTRFKDMLKFLEQFGIRVFSYDTGEEGGFTDASQETNFRMELDRLGFGTGWLDELQIGAQIDSANAHHEILAVLGNETGGRFWRGRDFEAGLRAADDDLSHYYLVGFRPGELDLDEDKYQRLKLKAPKTSYKVVSRRSRFVPGEAVTPQPEAVVLTDEGQVVEESAQPAPELTLSCHPTFYPANGQTLVVLPIRVAGPVEPQQLGPGAHALDLDITLTATIAGATVESGSRNVRLDIPPDAVAYLEHGFRLREAMLLPPSAIELSVALRLNGLRRSGTWQAVYQIPDRSSTSFGLTDLALLHPADPTPLLYDVFRKGYVVHGTEPPAALPDPLGDAVGRPATYFEGGFSKGVPLLAQVQITSPPAPLPEQQSPLSMDWELLPSSGGSAVAPPVRYRRLEMADQGALFDVLVDLDLAGVEPGEYTLRLTAKNLVDGQEDIRSASITITP